MPALVRIAFAACLAGAALGQSFTGLTVRVAAPNTMPEMRLRFSRGQYELHNATLVDMIRTAWNVAADNVVGGPEWLDERRFDLIATAPPGSSQQALRTMLQQALKDRFQLAVHAGSKEMPAYVITAEKKPRLQPATDPSEASGCARKASPADATVTYICRNMTMAALAKALPGINEASGYLFTYPVLDQTGLNGSWNFTLAWSTKRIWSRPQPGETVTIFDAFEKQLGLKLSLSKVPAPVLFVDAATEPKVPETQLPHLEFEVADIKPDPAAPACSNVRILPGGRVDIRMTIKGLIGEAWGSMHPNRILGGPKSMDDTCWHVLAKAAPQEDAVAGWVGAVWNGVDLDSMRLMLRAMLVDRFKLVAHAQDALIDGYALVAAKPKLRKANPANRPGCKEGPGDDGKDPRLTNPMASRLVTCRNMTLAHFAAALHDLLPGDVPVMDATGISGRYDMTLNFSPPALFQNIPAPNSDSEPSIPDGAISHFDALRSQLGLKLEPRKVMAPVLVVDSVNLTPTAN